eukprot:723145-Pleurochrysis_carterae.AAC.1
MRECVSACMLRNELVAMHAQRLRSMCLLASCEYAITLTMLLLRTIARYAVHARAYATQASRRMRERKYGQMKMARAWMQAWLQNRVRLLRRNEQKKRRLSVIMHGSKVCFEFLSHDNFPYARKLSCVDEQSRNSQMHALSVIYSMTAT